VSRRPISNQLRYRVLERDGFACRYCGASGVRLEIDHRMPVSKGGTNDPSNLVTSCRPCNNGKSADVPRWTIPSQRRFAVGAWVFQQAGEKFGHELPMWDAFNFIVDFCLSEEDCDVARQLVLGSDTWQQAKLALLNHAGYPSEEEWASGE